MPCFIDYLRFTIEGEILAVRFVDDLTKSLLCAAAPFCDSWSKPSSDPAGMAIAFLPTLNYGWHKVPTIPADESSRNEGKARTVETDLIFYWKEGSATWLGRGKLGKDRLEYENEGHSRKQIRLNQPSRIC